MQRMSIMHDGNLTLMLISLMLLLLTGVLNTYMLFPLQYGNEGVDEDCQRRCNRSDYMSTLDNSSLVTQTSQDVDRCPHNPASQYNFITIQQTSRTSATQKLRTNGVSGNSFMTVDFLSNLSSSLCILERMTIKEYEVYFRQWLHFWQQREIDPLLLNETETVHFVTKMINDGKGYSAINTARSAIYTSICNDAGLTIGNLFSVKRLMKSIFELRPPIPGYWRMHIIWDANIYGIYSKLHMGCKHSFKLFKKLAYQ